MRNTIVCCTTQHCTFKGYPQLAHTCCAQLEGCPIWQQWGRQVCVVCEWLCFHFLRQLGEEHSTFWVVLGHCCLVWPPQLISFFTFAQLMLHSSQSQRLLRAACIQTIQLSDALAGPESTHYEAVGFNQVGPASASGYTYACMPRTCTLTSYSLKRFFCERVGGTHTTCAANERGSEDSLQMPAVQANTTLRNAAWGIKPLLSSLHLLKPSQRQ